MPKNTPIVLILLVLLFHSFSICNSQDAHYALASPGVCELEETWFDWEEDPLDIFGDKTSREFIEKGIYQTYRRFKIPDSSINYLYNILIKQHGKSQEETYNILREFIMNSEFKFIFDHYNAKGRAQHKYGLFSEFIKGPVVADIGCGNGLLAEVIAENECAVRVIATDIRDRFIGDNDSLEFRIQPQKNNIPIDTSSVNTVVLTYVLHHIEPESFDRLLSNINRILKKGGILILLEESFSNTLKPSRPSELLKEFLKISPRNRKKLFTFLDWFNNNITGTLDMYPVIFRTIEESQNLFERTGFSLIQKKFLGIDEGNLNFSPRGLMVFKKESDVRYDNLEIEHAGLVQIGTNFMPLLDSSN